MWWPWMWKHGWSELHVLRVLYRLLPIFVVDTFLYCVTLIWAILHGVPEWSPPFGTFPSLQSGWRLIHHEEKITDYSTRTVSNSTDDAPSSKVGYILRTHLVAPYRAGRFHIHNDTTVKSISGNTLELSDGTMLTPTLVVAATGWSTDTSFLPGGTGPGDYDSLAVADIDRPMYLRFYDQRHPGIFYVSVSNGFMTYTENASFLSQAVERILRGEWTPPPPAGMRKNCREVVLHHVGLPGLLQTDLERAGFRNLRTKDVR